MKLHYYEESDSLYVELRSDASTATQEVADGINADLDATGGVVGFDVDQTSTRLDLTMLETTAVTRRSARAG